MELRLASYMPHGPVGIYFYRACSFQISYGISYENDRSNLWTDALLGRANILNVVLQKSVRVEVVLASSLLF